MRMRTECSVGFVWLLISLVSLTLVSMNAVAVTANVADVKSIARLYSAAFDRDPKVDGLNFWVSTYEGGRSIVSIAQQFYRSPEFNAKYGSLTDTQYVEQLYRNVLGRDGAAGGITFWVGHLGNGTPRAKVLAEFADSPENIEKTSATFSAMRYEGEQWVFEPGSEGPSIIAGEYFLDTDRMHYDCTDGDSGILNSVHNNFRVSQSGNSIAIEPLTGILVPGATITSSTDMTAQLSPDGSFSAVQTASGYSSIAASTMRLDYRLTGQFQNGRWSGDYSYTALFTGSGVTCTYTALFTGQQLIEGASQSPAGIWNGSIYGSDGFPHEAVAYVTESGELRVVTTSADRIIGTMTVKDDSFDAWLVSYAPVGFYYPSNGLTFILGNGSGTVLEKSTFYGSASYDGSPPSEFNFTYDPIYERTSSLSRIAGSYTGSDGTGYVESHRIDAMGRVTGSDTDGCRFSGAVSIINPLYNLYRIDVTISSCGFVNGEYSGLATLSDQGGRLNGTLTVTIGGPELVIGGVLQRD